MRTSLRRGSAVSPSNGSPSNGSPSNIAYVLKRYPRFSETFIVNELLAHERAGTQLNVYSLRPLVDTHFQPAIARVRAPVRYLASGSVRPGEFWAQLEPWLRDHPASVAALAGAIDAEGIDVYQAIELASDVVRRQIDHIHAHFATSATTVARLASLLTGVPYSFTAHAKDIYHESVDSSALRQKIADSAVVISVSDFNVSYLRSEYPDQADKVVRVFNGLTLDDFPFAKRTKNDRQPPLVLAVGRLVEKKGFDDLVQACALLRERGHTFRCVIVGGGELAGALQRQIDEADLGGIVQLAGPVPLDRVRQLMGEASMLVAPCVTASSGDRDGMPTVLLEAMACGTPCVATDVTGIPEIIHNRVTGLLVPERSPHDLAGAIAELLTSPALGHRHASAARARIEHDFDVDRNAALLRTLFASASHAARSLAEAV